MWGIVHNVVTPTAVVPNESKCGYGWRGHPGEFAEHLTDVAKKARERLTEFVDFADEEIGNGNWGEIDRFEKDRDFLTPATFVQAMRNVGLKRSIPSPLD